jgi:hypothetical protein
MANRLPSACKSLPLNDILQSLNLPGSDNLKEDMTLAKLEHKVVSNKNNASTKNFTQADNANNSAEMAEDQISIENNVGQSTTRKEVSVLHSNSAKKPAQMARIEDKVK